MVSCLPNVGVHFFRWVGYRRLSTIGVLAVQCAVVALVVGPWLRRDLRWIDIADGPHHLVRIFVIDAALADGQWYPRWLAHLYLGYGYPLLNFYAPATYYVAVALHRLGMTVYGSLQWTGVLAVALGATGACAFVRAMFPDRREAALLASATFLLAPYPFLTNLYIRAAVPEALALGLLPWLLLATWGAWRYGGAWLPALMLLMAALLLTHNISSLFGVGLLAAALPALPWLGGALPSYGRLPQTDLRRAGARTVAALAAGLGLSAFFWLPALAEGRYVQLDLAQGALYDFRTWLFHPLVVARGLAQPDYPHTRLGPADLGFVFSYSALSKALPEKISLGQALLWLFALVAPLWVGLTARLASRAGHRAKAGISEPETSSLYRPGAQLVSPEGAIRQAFFWGVLAAVCLFFATTWSMPFWERVPLLPLVQFPWRFYGPLALCLALSAAAGLASMPRHGPTAWAARSVAVTCVFVLGYGALADVPYTIGKEPAHDIDARDLVGQETNRYGAGTTSGGEFLPKSVLWADYETGARRGIRIYEEAAPQAGWQAGFVRILEGNASATGLYRRPNRIMAEVEAETPARLAFHQLLFPGWRAYVDGRATPVFVPYHEQLQASLGFMAVDVPPGTHRVEVVFGPTPARLAGSALSSASLALAAVWCAWHWFRRRRGGWSLGSGHVLRPVASLAVAAAGAAGCALAGAELSARPQMRYPASAAGITLDIASAVARSTAETRAPGGAGWGALPPFLEVRHIQLAGEARRWLYMHPPSAVSVRVHVPPHAYFQAGLALDPQTWSTPVGDGVRFILESDGPSGRQTLLDRQVNPRARGEDRGWVDEWISLEALAGQDVRLILRTDAAQDPAYDWAGWSNPQIVTWHAPRPHPGTRHQW